MYQYPFQLQSDDTYQHIDKFNQKIIFENSQYKNLMVLVIQYFLLCYICAASIFAFI